MTYSAPKSSKTFCALKIKPRGYHLVQCGEYQWWIHFNGECLGVADRLREDLYPTRPWAAKWGPLHYDKRVNRWVGGVSRPLRTLKRAALWLRRHSIFRPEVRA